MTILLLDSILLEKINLIKNYSAIWSKEKPFQEYICEEYNLDRQTQIINFQKFRPHEEFGPIIIILQNNYLEIWATLNLSPVAISQNVDLAVNLAETTAWCFQKTWATIYTHMIYIYQKVSQIIDNLRYLIRPSNVKEDSYFRLLSYSWMSSVKFLVCVLYVNRYYENLQ